MEHEVKTPKAWPFPRPEEPKPKMPMHLWYNHIEDIQRLRGKIWEDLAADRRDDAREKARSLRAVVDELVNVLELYDE